MSKHISSSFFYQLPSQNKVHPCRLIVKDGTLMWKHALLVENECIHMPQTEAHENQFYHKIATCVLQSVNVDYTPGKVASHQQGAPVLIKMSLSFMETEILTKDHILAGY